MPSLRERLKRDGRRAHDRVDEAFAVFDLARPEGFQGFLQAHAVALQAIVPEGHQDSGSASHADPAYLHRLVCRDLAALSAALGQPAGASPTPKRGLAKTETRCAPRPRCHPVAIDYVLLGSRLGLQVLRRRWQVSRDTAVLQASDYISLPSVSRPWAALCRRLAAQPGAGPEADRIVADALYIFEVFEEAAKSVKTSLSGSQTLG